MALHPDHENQGALRAKRRMSYFLLALLLIFFIEAGITFPFVDHTTRFQNILYALIVTAPFILINIIFIILTGKDLKKRS
jgi:hypothetical protein